MESNNEYNSGYDFPPMRASEFIAKMKDMPKHEDIIEGILPKGQVMLYAGDPWQGKSLEVQRLTCLFGIGGKFHGLQVKKCCALYITWEGNDASIADRMNTIIETMPDLTEEGLPVIKLRTFPLHITTDKGFTDMVNLINSVKEQYNIEVVVIDSFKYTFKGNPSKDNDVQEWWIKLQNIAKATEVTFILVWEMNKIIFTKEGTQDAFDISRLKTAYTTAYSVNTVVAIGEQKAVKTIDGKSTRVSLGHTIAIIKAKDAKGNFPPLPVKLDRKGLIYNGAYWWWDDKEKTYSVADEISEDAYNSTSITNKPKVYEEQKVNKSCKCFGCKNKFSNNKALAEHILNDACSPNIRKKDTQWAKEYFAKELKRK